MSLGSACSAYAEPGLCQGVGLTTGGQGRVAAFKSNGPPADAKKADGAWVEILPNPRPPDLTGRVAWSHES